MFSRYYIFACIVGCVVTESVPDILDNYSGPPINELPCIVIGGTCKDSSECPAGTRVTVEGLCPRQELRGVQCCHSVEAKADPKAVTCRSLGGECMPRCAKYLWNRSATDCEESQICCILVH